MTLATRPRVASPSTAGDKGLHQRGPWFSNHFELLATLRCRFASIGPQCDLMITSRSHWPCMPYSRIPFKCRHVPLPSAAFPSYRCETVSHGVIPLCQGLSTATRTAERGPPFRLSSEWSSLKAHVSPCFLGPLLETIMPLGCQNGVSGARD